MSTKASGGGGSDTLQVRAEHVTEGGFAIVVTQGDICIDDSDAIVNAADEAMQHHGGVAGAIVAAGGDEIQKESDDWVKKNGRVQTGGGVAATGAGKLPCKHVIHVVGPIWREPINGETVAKGEISSQDQKGRFVALTEECGNLTIGDHTLATGYTPQMGDRVKIYVGKKGGPGSKGPREFVVRYCAGIKHTVDKSDDELLRGCILAAFQKADELQCKSVSLPAISSGVFGFPLDKCAEIMVTCAEEFAKGAKHVRRISMTNRNAPTVAAMIDACRKRYGDGCVKEDAAKAAADKVLTTGKGKELKGPLLIVVDSTGAIVSKEPCPRTTAAKQRELREQGYFFHSSGPHSNNWVKGIPPPPDPLQARTFDPRGDWSKGGHGTNRGIPGMEDDAPAGGGGGKPKKNKKPKSAAAGAAGAADSDDQEDEKPKGGGGGGGQKEAGAAKAEAPLGREEVSKRIKAVQKKLRQAEDLKGDADKGKELNVDQKNKIASIGDMRKEIADLEAKMASL